MTTYTEKTPVIATSTQLGGTSMAKVNDNTKTTGKKKADSLPTKPETTIEMVPALHRIQIDGQTLEIDGDLYNAGAEISVYVLAKNNRKFLFSTTVPGDRDAECKQTILQREIAAFGVGHHLGFKEGHGQHQNKVAELLNALINPKLPA